MHAYSTNTSRTKALSVLAVFAVVFAIVANWFFEQLRLGPAWLISPPSVAAAYGILFACWDRFVWRWPTLHHLGLVDIVNVQGTYEGELISSWTETIRPVRMRIDQTWTRINIRFDALEPKSSTSYSVAAALAVIGDQEVRLTYTYQNQARPGVADSDMSDHDGTAQVWVTKEGRLSGRYFNLRGRCGTLELRSVTDRIKL